MASFDEIGEVSLDQLLAKRLTTPGGAVAPTIAPELFPVMCVENDRPEWGRPKGEQWSANRISIGAVAAQYTIVQFYLPSTARTLATITKLALGNVNTLLIARAVGISAGLAGWSAYGVANNPTDFRWPAGRSQLITESLNAVAQPTTNGIFAILPTTGSFYDQPIIIAPGTSLVIWTAAVNLVMELNVQWYERGAQPGELL